MLERIRDNFKVILEELHIVCSYMLRWEASVYTNVSEFGNFKMWILKIAGWDILGVEIHTF